MDELWGTVTDVKDSEHFVVKITGIATSWDNSYQRRELVEAQGAAVDRGDYVHVWVRRRDDDGVLLGHAVVEEGIDPDQMSDERVLFDSTPTWVDSDDVDEDPQLAEADPSIEDGEDPDEAFELRAAELPIRGAGRGRGRRARLTARRS